MGLKAFQDRFSGFPRHSASRKGFLTGNSFESHQGHRSWRTRRLLNRTTWRIVTRSFPDNRTRLQGGTTINSVSRQKPIGRRQIAISGLMVYTALWALIIGLFRQAVKLQQGTYTITQARLSDILMLIVSGLLFVAIALPIIVVVGRERQAIPVSLGCFFVGSIAIPILIAVLVTLDTFGIIKIDI